MVRFPSALLLLSAAMAPAALAQTTPQPLPEPVPMPPPIVAPVDKPYIGPIQLSVDVTNVADRVMKVHENIPVEPGAKEMVLLYPAWIPGDHAVSGPLDRLAGIVTKVDGKRVQWVRDRVNVFAFHIPLTPDAKVVNLDFDYLSPVLPSAGRIEFTDQIVNVEWNEVVMYPAGYFSRDIPFDPKITLPAGWQYGSALEKKSDHDNTLTFDQTPLNTLVDSPLYAGEYFKRIDLSPTKTDIVHLDLFADEAKDLDVTPEEMTELKNLPLEEDKLYASHHYKHYDFLLCISDKIGGVGLEHHQSSEDSWDADAFTDWSSGIFDRDLLGHESTHSWNGKFRRPGDLWTPNFNVPMRDDLLWVYEGLTQYYGNVLTSRAGMRSAADMRDIFAGTAAGFADSPGRDWRPLVDTTNQEIISHRRPVSWVSFQLPENYYTEGMLIWLDADTKIRQLTDNKKSLDDFAKTFFGVYNGSYITDQYDFDDVVNALNQTVPYDWATFLRTRVYDLHPEVPMNGFTQGGYKLVYSDTQIPWIQKAYEKYGFANFTTSLGFSVGSRRGGSGGGGARIGSVDWDSPAFNAGITPGMELISVNGTAYTPKVLTDALLAAEKSRQPLQLQFLDEDKYKTVSFPYYGGLHIPSLQRVDGTPDYLDDILAPSKSPLPPM
jgi:predicted metalloprotease with PDZ domain